MDLLLGFQMESFMNGSIWTIPLSGAKPDLSNWCPVWSGDSYLLLIKVARYFQNELDCLN